MKPHHLINILLISLSIVFSQCKDVFEEDLNDKEVELLAPADSAEIGPGLQTFWWQPVEGAFYYRLQIVDYSFDHITRVVMDSVLENTSFSVQLTAGKYEWRVLAENDYSAAVSPHYTLTVNDTIQGGLQVELVSPSGNYLNKNNVNFEWAGTGTILNYRFEIRNGTWDDNSIDTSAIITSTTAEIYLAEGQYAWGVQAESEGGFSLFSKKSLWIDVTSPGTPTLSSPGDASTVTAGSIDFEWQTNSDDGTEIYDSIYVSESETLNNIIESQRSENSTASVQLSNAGTYYWAVKSFDMAGNAGNLSGIRSIVVE